MSEMMNNFPRTDGESLAILEVSRQPRHDPEFDISAVIARHQNILAGWKAMNDWILLIEDLSPRSITKLIPVKKRYYQFCGLVHSVGPLVKSERVRPGIYAVWGLYNGQQVSLVNHQPAELKTWFVREMRILAVVDEKVRLSE